MSMNYKVLITTSGIGSRLGEFTKYTNKTLLRVGFKPVISHIIENYPEDTNFVITLGYYGNQVRDFLEMVYPDRHFEFVNVDNFQGEGSSLLYSMTCAKDKLQLPFIFHASDTITLDVIPPPIQNWNAGFKGPGSSHYTSFDVLGDKVKVFYEKGNISPDYLHVGVVGVNNYKLFWQLAHEVLENKSFESSLSDVDVLEKFINKDELSVLEMKTWFDIGSVEKIQEAKKFYSDKSFHVLDKVTESIYHIGDSIVKFFYDTQVCENRVLRTKYLRDAVPTVIDSKPNFFKYGYVEGKLYSAEANKFNFHSFLKWCEENLWEPVNNVDRKSFKAIAKDFYYDKTLKRVQQFQTSRGIKDSSFVINGQQIPALSELLAQVDFEMLSDVTPTTFHGDFILDNIIQQEQGGFKLIDWRQDFGGEIEAGDQYYDFAKLAHNLVVNHDIIENNHFTIEINNREKEIKVNIHRLQTLVDCETELFKYLQQAGYDCSRVKLLRSIIWLNMSPLHHHPFDLFLYYYGKYTLYNQLNN